MALPDAVSDGTARNRKFESSQGQQMKLRFRFGLKEFLSAAFMMAILFAVTGQLKSEYDREQAAIASLKPDKGAIKVERIGVPRPLTFAIS